MGYEKQKLVLIDFWATWCAPCIVANKQLEKVQGRNPDKLFVVSLSDEPVPVIAKHLDKRPSKLMVVADYDRRTTEKYHVKSWPYAVLLGSDGKKLWEGHPADLTQDRIDAFYWKQRKKNGPIEQLIRLHESPDMAIDLPQIEITYTDIDGYYFEKSQQRVYFDGRISDLCKHIFGTSAVDAIEVDPDKDLTLSIRASTDYWQANPYKIWDDVIKANELSIRLQEKESLVHEMRVGDQKPTWDKEYFVWDEHNALANYMIVGNYLKADNYRLHELAYLLKKITGDHYVLNDVFMPEEKFDWEIDISSAEAIRRDLSETYGVLVETKSKKMKVFLIN